MPTALKEIGYIFQNYTGYFMLFFPNYQSNVRSYTQTILKIQNIKKKERKRGTPRTVLQFIILI